MAIGRKKIAEAVRAFAAECAAGTAPELGCSFGSPGCAVQRIGERLDSRGYDVATELLCWGNACNDALARLYAANDYAPSEKRAAAVVAPLNALADALEAES